MASSILNRLRQTDLPDLPQSQGSTPSMEGFDMFVQKNFPNASASVIKAAKDSVSKRIIGQQQSQLVEKGGMPYADLVKANPGAALDLMNKGYKPENQPTAIQRTNDDKLEKAKDLLKGSADYLINEVKLSENDKLKAQVSGNLRNLLSKVRNDPKLSAYNKTKEGLRVQLVKLLGDTGNVALQEQISAGKLFPQVTDTKSEVEEKVKVFNLLVDAAKQSPTNNQSQDNTQNTPRSYTINTSSGTYSVVEE